MEERKDNTDKPQTRDRIHVLLFMMYCIFVLLAIVVVGRILYIQLIYKPENVYVERFTTGDRKVVMILDNGPVHRSNAVRFTADMMDIVLIFLPPYSPQLNPIELIWKTIKARISNMFLLHRDHLVAAVQELFMQESSKDSYLTAWKRDFLLKLGKLGYKLTKRVRKPSASCPSSS